jgi:hypothetical protein
VFAKQIVYHPSQVLVIGRPKLILKLKLTISATLLKGKTMNYLTRAYKLFAIACLSALLFACASTPNYSEYVLGQWDTEVSGFPVTLEFSDTEISVIGFGQSIPYKLEGNTISFEFQGMQISTIEIVNDNEMVHTNTTTQAEQTMKRKL